MRKWLAATMLLFPSLAFSGPASSDNGSVTLNILGDLAWCHYPTGGQGSCTSSASATKQITIPFDTCTQGGECWGSWDWSTTKDTLPFAGRITVSKQPDGAGSFIYGANISVGVVSNSQQLGTTIVQLGNDKSLTNPVFVVGAPVSVSHKDGSLDQYYPYVIIAPAGHQIKDVDLAKMIPSPQSGK